MQTFIRNFVNYAAQDCSYCLTGKAFLWTVGAKSPTQGKIGLSYCPITCICSPLYSCLIVL